MPALEEVDCEFIGPGGARVERALGDVVRCPVAVRGACATSDAHPRDASRQQSDSAKPSLARAVRDAALSNGACERGAWTARAKVWRGCATARVDGARERGV